MVKKIGRNDPCPCGSGKKYKNCCLRQDYKKRLHPIESFTVTPTKKPEVIDYHIVRGGRTWWRRPGRLLAILTSRPKEMINQEIQEVFKDFPKKNNSLVYKINICEHKLYAVRYHMDNFISEELVKIQEFNEDYIPPDGAQMTTANPTLIFEMESFLFQVKSSLDVFAMLLNRLFGLKLRSFGAGKDVIDALKKNIDKIGKQKVNKLVSIIEKSKKWVEELNDMRNRITHLSDLEGFLCFLKDPYTGGEECIIYYPSMPDGTRATKYMDSIWKKLISFYKNILLIC